MPDTRVGVDSALLFGLALAGWQAGASLAVGLAAPRAICARPRWWPADHARLRRRLDGRCRGRADARARLRRAGTFIASEPHADDPGWREPADRTVLHVDAEGVTETSLAGPAVVARSAVPTGVSRWCAG